MAITIKRDGYAQVELNHVSAPRDGHVYGQLPAAEGIDVLEQGMYVHYDMAAGNVNLEAGSDTPWMMVYNEEKHYDYPRKSMHKDWALKREDAYDGEIYPRLFTMSVGDIYTTNAVVEGTYSLGDDLSVDEATGFLKKGDAPLGAPSLRIVKETTLPDMQPALKVQVIGA